MFTKLFWKDAGERAISTFAQTAIAIIGVAAPLSGMDLADVNYIPVLMVSSLAAILSILKSVGAATKSGTESASLSTEVEKRNK